MSRSYILSACSEYLLFACKRFICLIDDWKHWKCIKGDDLIESVVNFKLNGDAYQNAFCHSM